VSNEGNHIDEDIPWQPQEYPTPSQGFNLRGENEPSMQQMHGGWVKSRHPWKCEGVPDNSIE
jgi:hypothetical protein